MVCIDTPVEVGIKGTGEWVKSMVKDIWHYQQEMFMMDSLKIV